MSVKAYHRPGTLPEALRLKAEDPGARFMAGGMDLMVAIRAGIERPDALISLRHIDALGGIEAGGRIRLGAMTTIREILEHPGLAGACPVLRDAARPFGSMQVRNLATVGGNLCNGSPCADMPPALLVLDAVVRLEGPGGGRDVPIEAFFLGPKRTCLAPDEVLTSIAFDRPSPGARATYLRQGRVRMDLARVGVAVLLEMDGDRCARARVAAGAVAPRPIRLREAEVALEGHRLDPDRIAEARARAAGAVAPITDVRAGADYRRHMTGVLLQRAVESLLGGRGDAR